MSYTYNFCVKINWETDLHEEKREVDLEINTLIHAKMQQEIIASTDRCFKTYMVNLSLNTPTKRVRFCCSHNCMFSNSLQSSFSLALANSIATFWFMDRHLQPIMIRHIVRLQQQDEGHCIIRQWKIVLWLAIFMFHDH